MLDIKRLKEIQTDLDKKAKEEFYENLNEEVIQFLQSKFFKDHFLAKTRKQTQQSARVLNNWENEGLIDRINPNEGKTRKFSKGQSIWLDLVSQLREFGFPLEKIKNLRKGLFISPVKKFSPFEYALMHSIVQEAIILIIKDDATFSLIPESLYIEYLKKTILPPHLHFNLLNLSESEFPNNNFNMEIAVSIKSNLTEQELELIYFLRTGDFESIKIRLKDGLIYLLEGTKKLSNQARIVDILKNADYQNIEIITEQGRVVNIASTIKKKIIKQ